MWSIVLSLLLLQAAPSLPVETLTEVDRLRLEVVALQDKLVKAYEANDGCATALAPHRHRENVAAVQATAAKAKAAIEAAHPGYHLTEAGTLEKRPASAPATPSTP